MTAGLYGISNCATVKKARLWLEAHGVDYVFHDFKKTPPSAEQTAAWAREAGIGRLLNRRGTTWRALDDAQRAAAEDEGFALRLMCEKPSLIKRPVLEAGGRCYVGFDEQTYREIFGL